MSHPRTRPGGHVLANEGEKILNSDWNEAGTLQWQTLTAIIARFCENDVSGDPFQGFFGDDCKVTVSAGLTMAIAPGLGFYYDSSEADVFDPIYKPIWVPVATTQALDAHDATNPRYDILSLAPATTDAESESRNVKNGSGVISSQSVNKLRRLGYTISVTKGTAGASPSVPATPSGHIKIAEVLVPAVSGAVTIYDTRPILRFGQDLATHPRNVTADFVPGESTELEVSATSPASMTVTVNNGDAVISHTRFSYPFTRLTIGASHATLGRIDAIVADDDGTVKVMAGTANASPPPASTLVTAGQILLASVSIAATVTSITGADITDARVREPLRGADIKDNTVEARSMKGKNKAAFVTLPTGAGAEGAVVANGFDFDIQLYDGDNNELANNAQVLIEVFDPNMQPAGSTMTITDQGAGSMVSTTGKDKVIFQLDATGLGHIRIFDASGSATGVYRVRFTVLSDYVAIITHASLTFA